MDMAISNLSQGPLVFSEVANEWLPWPVTVLPVHALGIQFHLRCLPGKLVNVTRLRGGFGVLVLDLTEVVESVYCHSQPVGMPKLDVLVVFLHSCLNGQPVGQKQTWPHSQCMLCAPTVFSSGSSLTCCGNYSWSNWSLRMKAIYSFRTLGTTHLTSQHPIQEDWNHQGLLS